MQQLDQFLQGFRRTALFVQGIVFWQGRWDAIDILCQAQAFEGPDDVAGEIELPPVEAMEG